MVWLFLSIVFQLKELPTFKDNDFLNDGAKIYIGPEQRKKLLDTLQSDVDVSTVDYKQDINICLAWEVQSMKVIMDGVTLYILISMSFRIVL